ETVQNNPALLVESNLLVAFQNQDNFMETSIPVPTLNWQDVSNKHSGFAESDVVQSHGGVLVENTSPSAPVSAPQFRAFRRASEVSTVSQVSGMADSYTASNIAN
ncbi:putative Membrane-associated phosphatidylinositol transfer protein, partial [Naja naja]